MPDPNGRCLEVMEWARAQGCPWDLTTTDHATLSGHFAIFMFALHEGCPLSMRVVIEAGLGGSLQILTYLAVGPGRYCWPRFHFLHRPISVYRFPRRALTLCPQLCMGIQPGARFPARSADALPATLYGHFTQAIYRNRPIARLGR